MIYQIRTGIPSHHENMLPAFYYLGQNYPNPFNAATVIPLVLPQQSYVKLEIYNLLGQKIRTLLAQEREAGNYKIPWDGRNEVGNTVPGGVYFCRLHTGSFTTCIKMLYLQ